jgi:hypothetical protein
MHVEKKQSNFYTFCALVLTRSYGDPTLRRVNTQLLHESRLPLSLLLQQFPAQRAQNESPGG